MPHRCMNCGSTYEEDSEELIDGCECGSSLFMYEKDSQEVSEEEREEVKSDVKEMMEEGIEKENIKLEFDLDSIVVEEEGVYNINVSRLLQEIPLVIRKTEGVYHVNLPSAFKPGKADLDTQQLDP